MIGVNSCKPTNSNIIRNNTQANIEIQRQEEKEDTPSNIEVENRKMGEEVINMEQWDEEGEENERQKEQEDYDTIQFLKLSIQKTDNVINYLQARLQNIETSETLQMEELSTVNAIVNLNYKEE